MVRTRRPAVSLVRVRFRSGSGEVVNSLWRGRVEVVPHVDGGPTLVSAAVGEGLLEGVALLCGEGRAVPDGRAVQLVGAPVAAAP